MEPKQTPWKAHQSSPSKPAQSRSGRATSSSFHFRNAAHHCSPLKAVLGWGEFQPPTEIRQQTAGFSARMRRTCWATPSKYSRPVAGPVKDGWPSSPRTRLMLNQITTLSPCGSKHYVRVYPPIFLSYEGSQRTHVFHGLDDLLAALARALAPVTVAYVQRPGLKRPPQAPSSGCHRSSTPRWLAAGRSIDLPGTPK